MAAAGSASSEPTTKHAIPTLQNMHAEGGSSGGICLSAQKAHGQCGGRILRQKSTNGPAAEQHAHGMPKEELTQPARGAKAVHEMEAHVRSRP